MSEKRRYTFVFWLAITLILVLNILLWIYLNQVESQFTSSLRERLLAENRFISRIINDEYLSMIIPGQTNSIEYITLLQTLENIRQEDSLQSVLIMDPDGRILVSAPEIISLQTESIRADNNLYRQALDGSFVTTAIQQIDSERFMASFGPVFDIYGSIIGVQIVEVKATYFNALDNLRSQLFIFSFINIMVITVIALFLFRMIDKTIRYQAMIKDREHLAQLGTMSASVAHELRNPLGIIEGSNELIRKKYGMYNDEIFNYIPAETKRLSKIIDAFLAFARSPQVNKKPFYLKDLLTRLKIGLQNKRNIKINFPDIDREMKINSDQDLLEQAVLNILINAIEAAEDQSEVNVSIQTQKDTIVISVYNKGPLISRESLQHIFKPFFTTKEQGTGLGLAISERTIDLLGGSITVKSTPTTGTTFYIAIPK